MAKSAKLDKDGKLSFSISKKAAEKFGSIYEVEERLDGFFVRPKKETNKNMDEKEWDESVRRGMDDLKNGRVREFGDMKEAENWLNEP